MELSFKSFNVILSAAATLPIKNNAHNIIPRIKIGFLKIFPSPDKFSIFKNNFFIDEFLLKLCNKTVSYFMNIF